MFLFLLFHQNIVIFRNTTWSQSRPIFACRSSIVLGQPSSSGEYRFSSGRSAATWQTEMSRESNVPEWSDLSELFLNRPTVPNSCSGNYRSGGRLFSASESIWYRGHPATVTNYSLHMYVYIRYIYIYTSRRRDNDRGSSANILPMKWPFYPLRAIFTHRMHSISFSSLTPCQY